MIVAFLIGFVARAIVKLWPLWLLFGFIGYIQYLMTDGPAKDRIRDQYNPAQVEFSDYRIEAYPLESGRSIGSAATA